jgi:POT family proton-dependent oligopeptide transporter
MLYAAIVQHLIYTNGPCYKHPKNCEASFSARRGAMSGNAAAQPVRIPNHVNVLVQALVYILIAIRELFAFVTSLKYAYENSPKDMKSIVQAISSLVAGVGSACAIGLTPIAHDPYLVIFYACIAIIMAVTTFIFWYLFRNYDNHTSDKD